MKPTQQQQNFLDALTQRRDNLALIARAGCGKTSTILMGVNEIVRHQPGAEIAVCAFNKAIATEVKEKLEENGHTDWKKVQAATLHSMGFSLIKFLWKPKIDEKKVRNIVREYASRYEAGAANSGDSAKIGRVCLQYGSQVENLVRYAKQAGFGFFEDCAVGDSSAWYRLADHFDVNGLDDTTEADLVVRAAKRVFMDSKDRTDVVDFDDMILLPLIYNLKVNFQKDYVFLDEAQDLSRARQALAKKFVRHGSGRMIVVGDDRQAIYGFSGADAAALDNLVGQLGAHVLPLTYTWRCPRSVVDLAQDYVPDIHAAPGAPEGSVSTAGKVPEKLGPGDAILCRKTAPLISLAYRLLRDGTPCRVEGRAIGEGLLKLAERWKIKEISTLMERLEDYREREVQKAMARDNESKAEEVADRVDTLLGICEECVERGKKNISDVRRFVEDLFADGDESVVVLATYHRSKGREWNRVILLDHGTHHPSRAARKQWQLDQEDNLAYVAFTRSQNELIFLESEAEEGQEEGKISLYGSGVSDYSGERTEEDFKSPKQEDCMSELHTEEENNGAEATEATEGTEATENTEGGGKGRPSKYPDNAVISMGKDQEGNVYGPDNNPKRAGSASAQRFALYREGMTVKEYVEAGGQRTDIAWDAERSFIEVAGE